MPKSFARRTIVAVLSVLVGPAFLVALSLPASGSAPAPRSDAEDYQDISTPLVFVHASNPASPTSCKATVLIAFKDIKGWDEIYLYTASYGGAPQEPPYSDTYTMYPGVVYTAPSGTHWSKISEVPGGGGSTPTDCSDVSLAQQKSHGPTGTMTYKIDGQCDFARTDVRDADKAVSRAQKKVKNTSGKAHDKAVAKLKKAKKDLKKFKKAFDKNCTLPPGASN